MANRDLDLLKTTMKMKNVNRFSGFDTIKPINLLEHGFRSSMIFTYLCEGINIKYTGRDLINVLMHDSVETLTGDLLWPVKQTIGQETWDVIEHNVIENHGPHLERFTEEHLDLSFSNTIMWVLLKLADYLDGWVYIQEEKRKGNRDKGLKEAENNYINAIEKITRSIMSNPIKEDVMTLVQCIISEFGYAG